MNFKQAVCLALVASHMVYGRDDGTVRTPPMGWLSWSRYGCEIDCKRYPKACINEQLYREQADRLSTDGYKELGYSYVNIDDCWSEMERDVDNRLVANKQRFPSGMKALADYVHSKGLKLGIYGDVGPKTCAGYPGQNGKNDSGDYYTLDAKTFAEWGVDSLKFDGCNQDVKQFDHLYPQMGNALNTSGRPIVYICEWPPFQVASHVQTDYKAVTDSCHVFGSHSGDIQQSWESIASVLDYFGDNYDWMSKYHDMLVVGNYGLSHEQSRTQFAMWAMFSAPLYMSNDLRDISTDDMKILQNKAIIGVNQDRNGVLAKRLVKVNSQQVWVKRVEPQVNGQWSYAVVYIDANPIGDKHYINLVNLEYILPDAKPTTEYVVHDLYMDEGKDVLGTLKSSDNLELLVKTGGGCRMVKLVPK
ncbi:unnamed protein product [Oppiella nova]|uniref:Alpha-galactosidase n=1 Tax=Oppiella nova TaxID=334625 RepID=A0A7R9LMB7_9ACAR|nr:unnamed protein product [Oppiella nova]CAG2164960.1 unnamed protein product [Oppiella nova]